MIKLFTAQQIKEWDNYTILNEPISSLDLMERASFTFVEWYQKHHKHDKTIYIFCGPGNNGGDGFAISRLLLEKGYQVRPFLISKSLKKLSIDCKINYKKIKHHIQIIDDLESIESLTILENSIIIDALFGIGLSRPLEGIYKLLVNQLNLTSNYKISVDIPSGMYCDRLNNINDRIFKTNKIISFQTPKRAFFLKENNIYYSSYTVLDIGLSKEFYELTKSEWHLNEQNLVQKRHL
ncbi:NAD(P)H-hydrate epimerase [Pseudofulvibacter geojedonensis]|uniref:NAD(P)H-hydrate epimerase n=1 Tax=Pseudofulvibacter geojedonensis TaxID=1123758 RepID=A0ABW3I518_9FLAO